MPRRTVAELEALLAERDAQIAATASVLQLISASSADLPATRRLSLEEIIAHLIIEHDVPTLGDRAEALAFLEEQRQEFERRRTDPHRSAAIEPPPTLEPHPRPKRRR